MRLKTLSLLLLLTLFSSNLLATELYSHDGNGNATSGDKQLLTNMALSGKKLAVKIDVNGPAIYQGNLVQEHNGEICLMTTLFAANVTSVSSFNAVHAPYSANFCTDGHEYVRHSNGAFYNNSFSMTWILVD